MVAELPEYVTKCTADNVKASMMCYADDSTLYASSNSIDSLLLELECMSEQMIAYCRKVGLVINIKKTQMLVSGIKSNEFMVKVGGNSVYPSKEPHRAGMFQKVTDEILHDRRI